MGGKKEKRGIRERMRMIAKKNETERNITK
jgi:hypothetical protein